MSSASLFVIRVKGSQGVDDAAVDDRHWLHTLGTFPHRMKCANVCWQLTLPRSYVSACVQVCMFGFRLRSDHSGISSYLRACILALPACSHEGL